jgi:hypothetical protein
MLGLVATVGGFVQGVGLAFVDGGGSDDTITDSGTGFITQGFAPGDVLFVTGATTAANDAGCTGVVVSGVVAGTLTIPTGSVDTAEAGIAKTIVGFARGGSLKDVLKDGVLRIYSGAQPASPDNAVAGTLLLEVTVDAGAFVHGAFANGVEFGDAASGIISKAAGETWQDQGLANGTAGWFRFCANPSDTGIASTTLARLDGSVGTSGADLNMSSTSIVSGSTYTIDTMALTLPEYYGA